MHADYVSRENEFTARELALGWLLGISLLSVAKATAGPTHHHGYLEIIYCLKGSFTYVIDRNRPVSLLTGMGIVIPEQTDHPLRGNLIQPGLRVVLHVASDPRPGAHSTFAPKDLRQIRQLLIQSACRPFRIRRAVHARLKEAADILRQGGESATATDRMLLRLLCEDILIRTARQQTMQEDLREPLLMSDAVAFLEEHFAERLPIAALVNRIGYSRSRFFDLFREHTGLTPHEYLVRLRIRKAEELLRTEDTPIGDIARQVGFGDYIHFTTVFRKYTGRTASETRLAVRRT